MTGLELGLVLLSALLHASWNAATKGSAHPTAFLIAIELISFALYLPVLALGFRIAEIPRDVWLLAGASGFAHAFYVLFLTRGYVHAPLSVVYPIARSTPALVPLLAIPLLGEQVTAIGALGIACVVAGVWAVQTDGRIDRESFLSLGAGFAYLTLLTTVAYSVVDKEAMRLLGEASWSGSTPRPLAYMALFYVPYLPSLLLLSWRTTPLAAVKDVFRTELASAFGSGLFGITSYAIVLYVLQTAPVSYVVAVRQASVLFAVGLGVVLLRERPGPVRVLGAALNVTGVSLIALFA